VLDFAEFNVRAQKVYERAGFRVTGGLRVRDGVTFVEMEEREAPRCASP
jgi:RimJ/RimL family protein N-acetyltransferase